MFAMDVTIKYGAWQMAKFIAGLDAPMVVIMGTARSTAVLCKQVQTVTLARFQKATAKMATGLHGL